MLCARRKTLLSWHGTLHPAAAAAASSNCVNLVRSQSVDQEFMTRTAAPHPSPPRSAAGSGVRSSRHDSLIVDLQTRLGAVSRECCTLRVELERTRDQLHASTHSVRVFWSPELKRERALRKDESIRLAIVSERLRILLRANAQVRPAASILRIITSLRRRLNLWESDPSTSLMCVVSAGVFIDRFVFLFIFKFYIFFSFSLSLVLFHFFRKTLITFSKCYLPGYCCLLITIETCSYIVHC